MQNKLNHRDVPLAVIITSAISGLLAIIHLFVPGLTIDTIGLALLFLAILPWIIPYLQRSVKHVDILGNRIEFLETEVNKQQRVINDLVIFSISSSLVEILSHLYHKKEYKYYANEGGQRNLRFLRNHGYVHYFRFDELQNEQDLVGTLRLTPAGELLVQERERREKQ
jgi:hypothetical protein